MFKRLIIYVAISLFSFLTVDAKEIKPINCSPELQKHLLNVLKVPEARDLIYDIQQEGAIQILQNNDPIWSQFGAYFDLDRRIIFINSSAYRTEGEMIGSLLFELHNAATNSQLNALDHLALQGRIDKERYIRSVEYIEYKNSLKTAHIAKCGIDAGFFPPDAIMHTYKDFDEHYRWQIAGGHSALIGKTFDQLRASKR